MSEPMMIGLFIIGIIAFVTILDIRNRIKLKEQIKAEWGKFPRDLPKDSEESLLKAYHFESKLKKSQIDDITWNDLDLYEVFRRINLTYSSIGSEELYQTLRTYELEQSDLTELEKLITYFKENPKERELISYHFARLGKRDFNHARAYLNQQITNPLKQHHLFIFLGLLPILSLISAFFIGGIGALIMIASLCFNTIFYLAKKSQIETELGAMSYLVQGIALGNNLSKQNTPVKEELEQSVKPFKSVLKFAFAFRVKSGGDAEMFIEMLSTAFLIPFISYGSVSNKLSEHSAEAKKIWQLIGSLEVAIAVLNLRTIYKDYWCHPEFKEGGVIGDNVIHPLLSEPVPNPVNWTKSTLITGSNASGKSTYVRAVAINCLFAQTLNTCLATSFTLQRGHIISSMGVQDSIIDGDSYFIAELKSLHRLITQVEKEEFCYCFIDEILKGTNTIERIAASSSVISWLTKQNQLAFIATHDIELPQILHEECANIHFEETVSKEEGVTFDYLLKDGVATSRNAINLIDSMDFPKSIIEESFKKAQFFDKNRSWED